MNDCTIIVFGATGDLGRRKLIPALYSMVAKGLLDNVVIVGSGLDDVPVATILDRAREFIVGTIDAAVWQRLRERFFYKQVNLTNTHDQEVFKQFVLSVEKKYNSMGNRLVYMATAPSLYCPLTEFLGASGLLEKLPVHDKRWHRIIYEKPFGYDLTAAREINACIDKLFYEHQIYRIDHYLTKDLVSNLALIRFTNCVFEPLWNNRYIDNVQIVLSEKIGIEGRGIYYDKYGALSDVVQNHMLEILALIGMEAPEKLTGEFIRNERVKVLQKVRFVDGILGQYDGYTKEPAVAPNSTTETFAALFLMIDNPRWAGVPFYLKTGKFLDKRETVVHLKFKQVDCLLTQQCPSESNYLSIRLVPEELFTLILNARKPGSQELVPMTMEYCHSCLFGAITPTAHEALLIEVLRGEQSISVRFDEIEYAWKVIEAVRAQQPPVYHYEKGSAGPKEVELFAKKHGMRWRT